MIGPLVSQLSTRGGLTLLPCSPVPQDAEHRDDQEDGKESRQPSEDAAAPVLISARKWSAMPQPGGEAEEDASQGLGRGARRRKAALGWAVWWERVISLWTWKELSCVNAHWMPGVCL